MPHPLHVPCTILSVHRMERRAQGRMRVSAALSAFLTGMEQSGPAPSKRSLQKVDSFWGWTFYSLTWPGGGWSAARHLAANLQAVSGCSPWGQWGRECPMAAKLPVWPHSKWCRNFLVCSILPVLGTNTVGRPHFQFLYQCNFIVISLQYTSICWYKKPTWILWLHSMKKMKSIVPFPSVLLALKSPCWSHHRKSSTNW